jgi:hypothetical protein
MAFLRSADRRPVDRHAPHPKRAGPRLPLNFHSRTTRKWAFAAPILIGNEHAKRCPRFPVFFRAIARNAFPQSLPYDRHGGNNPPIV